MTRLPRARLERRRSPRAPGGRGRRARRARRRGARAPRRSTRPSRSGVVLDQPRLPQRLRAGRDRARPEELLDACKEVERELGRAAGRRPPRPAGDRRRRAAARRARVRSERLRLPHPEVTRRRFVLVPLLELDPELDAPGGRAPSQRGAGATRRTSAARRARRRPRWSRPLTATARGQRAVGLREERAARARRRAGRRSAARASSSGHAAAARVEAIWRSAAFGCVALADHAVGDPAVDSVELPGRAREVTSRDGVVGAG